MTNPLVEREAEEIPLNPWRIPLRAENLSADQIEQIALRITPPLSRRVETLVDFFLNESFYRRFDFGLKGWGKTLAVLIALNRAIRRSPEFLPVMLSFSRRRHTLYIRDPLRIASEADWGNRLKLINSLHTFRKRIQRCTCLVIDDIHYALEYCARAPTILNSLLGLLSDANEKSFRGSKVVMVSEEPLGVYSSLFQTPCFERIVSDFGFIHDKHYRSWEWHLRTDYSVPKELTYFSLSDWVEFANVYGNLQMEPLGFYVLYNISPCPRALLKWVRLFKENLGSVNGIFKITDKQLFSLAMDRLKKQGVREPLIKTFEWLFKTAAVVRFSAQETLESLQTLGSGYLGLLTRRIAEEFENRYPQVKVKVQVGAYEDPVSIIRRAARMLGTEKFREVAWDVFWRFRAGTPKIVDENLDDFDFRAFFSNEMMREIEKVARGKRDAPKEYPVVSIDWHYLTYYKKGVLFTPFKMAFEPYLTERTSSEIIARRLKGLKHDEFTTS